MANITVTIPDDVYRAARIRAAERGTSVSALVAEYLRSLADNEVEWRRLEEQRYRVISEINRFSASENVARDELYDRGVR